MIGYVILLWGALLAACAQARRFPARTCAALVYACMAGQIALLAAEGKADAGTALPLHLCSFTALLTGPMVCSRRQALVDFACVLGVPGALLALAFPAGIRCQRQAAMDFFFLSLHALLIAAPALALLRGARPSGRARGVFAVLGVLLALAGGANALLGTNYLFLRAAPGGTPLTLLFALGQPWYALSIGALLSLYALFGCFCLRVCYNKKERRENGNEKLEEYP